MAAMQRAAWGTTALMGFKSWKPGTSRWLYLLTGVYAVGLAVSLPLAIAVDQEQGWVLFSLIMTSGVCNIIAAFSMRRHARRSSDASATTPAPDLAREG